jgi:4-hydroxy-2-oxoheptanedioate aldolase
VPPHTETTRLVGLGSRCVSADDREVSLLNIIQQAMADGRPSYGVWAVAPSASSAETLGRGGLDWILFDTQHGAVGWSELLGLIQAAELGGTSAMVRVGANNPRLIMRALDMGAIGVVVPLVSTAEQALTAAEATRYPPHGIRSFGPVRRFYDPDVASASTTCLVMIETAEGMANLDAIAATPGIDGLFVGPVDLGLALGAGLQPSGDSDVLREAVARVVDAADRHGIIAGAASLNPSHAESLLAAGLRLVTVGSDNAYLNNGLKQDRERTAQWTGRFGRTEVALSDQPLTEGTTR